MLVSSAVAGFGCLILCIRTDGDGRSFRFTLLESIPGELKLGVKAGVGVLLASQAIDSLHKPNDGGFDNFKIVFFTVGLALLIASDVFAKRDVRRALGASLSGFMKLIVPLALGFIYHRAGPVAPTPGAPLSEFIFFKLNLSSCSPESIPLGMILISMLCFTLILVFIIVTDIPGTPYEIFKLEKPADEKQYDQAVEGSFFVDSIMAIANPLINLGPSIYYSENFIAKDFGNDALMSRKPAIICAFGYVGFAAFIALTPLQIPIAALKEVSLSAVAPVLFLVGLKITASSMLSDYEKGIEDKSKGRQRSNFTLYYYMPAAATALITHFAGLSLGLPVGVIVYTSYAVANREDIEKCL